MKTNNFQFSIFNFQLLLLFTGVLFSCNDFEDDYSTSPNHLLSFSRDTVPFDTVFTTIGSATGQLMVYNKNSKPLNIESVRLESGSASNFYINVDGRSGTSFSNIPILEKDSMFVFVEVTVDPTGQNNPLLIEDRIEFITNGVKQTVLLQAHGQDANIIKGGLFLTEDTTFTAERPYLIYDSIVVSKGARLTLEKGVGFYMHQNAKLIVEGTLTVTGTLEEPVLFRGDRLDNYSSKIPYDRLPGQWDGIYFGSESFENVLDHVSIRNANTGLRLYESTPDRSKLKISNAQIKNMNKDGLYAENCHIEAVNTEISNIAGKAVALYGGEYYFAHCSFINYLILRPGRTDPVLNLMNSFPLSAVFDNCIIDGSYSEGSEVLTGEINIDNSGGAELNYRFNHCAVKTKKNEAPEFINVRFITNSDAASKPRYKTIGDSENGYFYDYRPDISKDKDENPLPEQPVIGKADPAVAARYPQDSYGISRITGEDGPDIGAYEYVPEPEKE